MLCKEIFRIAGHNVTVEIADKVTESDAECWVHTIWIDGKYEANGESDVVGEETALDAASRIAVTYITRCK
jgi:hypothetical protein